MLLKKKVLNVIHLAEDIARHVNSNKTSLCNLNIQNRNYPKTHLRVDINTRTAQLKTLTARKIPASLVKNTNPHRTYISTEGSLLWRLRWYETATNSPQNTEKSTGMC